MINVVMEETTISSKLYNNTISLLYVLLVIKEEKNTASI